MTSTRKSRSTSFSPSRCLGVTSLALMDLRKMSLSRHGRLSLEGRTGLRMPHQEGGQGAVKKRKGKTTVESDEVVEVVDLVGEEADSGGGGGVQHVPRRRALKRRQTSQSPVKGSNTNSSEVKVTTSQGRRMSADSAVGTKRSTASPVASASVLRASSLPVVAAPAAATAKVVVGGQKESIRMRQMLLSQLEVIKKQSEDIVAKDKRLKELQKENERLRVRLRRMEERKTSTSTTSQPTTPPATGGVCTAACTTVHWQQHCHVIVPQIQKRQKQDKAVLTDISDVVHGTIKEGGTSTSTSGTDREKQQPPPAPAEDVPKKKRRRRSNSKKEMAKKDDKVETRKRAALLECPHGEYPLLRGDDLVAREREEVVSILRDSADVPGWRRLPKMTPSYSMEGTEDVEDAAMLQRHSKPEADEKRRKRWDVQHLREQRRLARLKATYEKSRWNNVDGSSSSSSSSSSRASSLVMRSLASLLPPVEEATHICIAESLPVSAFGLRLSAPESLAPADAELGQQGYIEFTLPWSDAE